MTTELNPHTLHRFDDELNEIATLVSRMGELAANQLKRAAKSLRKENVSKAKKVIERDRKLNDLDVEIDDKIIHLIAKRAPVARDLRQIITIGKVVTDLERSGDEARKIARLCIHFYGSGHHPPSDDILHGIHSMAKFVGLMLTSAMESFASLDTVQAFEVLGMNDEVEKNFDAQLRQLSTFVMEDSRNVGYFVDIVLGIRALERFGGHAKNIAGHVIFLARNQDVRHLDTREIGLLLGVEES